MALDPFRDFYRKNYLSRIASDSGSESESESPRGGVAGVAIERIPRVPSGEASLAGRCDVREAFLAMPNRRGRGKGLNEEQRQALEKAYKAEAARGGELSRLTPITEAAPRQILIDPHGAGYALMNRQDEGDHVGRENNFAIYNAAGLHDGKKYIVFETDGPPRGADVLEFIDKTYKEIEAIAGKGRVMVHPDPVTGKIFFVYEHGAENEIAALRALANRPVWDQAPSAKFKEQLKYFKPLQKKLHILAKADPMAYAKQKKEAHEALEDLRQVREEYHDRHLLPVFKPTHGDPSGDHRLVSEDEFISAPQVDGVPVVEEAGDIPHFAPTVVTEDFLKKFEANAYADPSLAYEFGGDGCYARATWKRDALIAAGVDPQDIRRVFLVEPNKSKWPYHTAIAVRYFDADGKQCVRILDFGQVYKKSEWVQVQTKEPLASTQPVNEPSAIPRRMNEFNCYLVPCDMVMRVATESGRHMLHFEKETAEVHRNALLRLSHFRKDKDTIFINGILGDA